MWLGVLDCATGFATPTWCARTSVHLLLQPLCLCTRAVRASCTALDYSACVQRQVCQTEWLGDGVCDSHVCRAGDGCDDVADCANSTAVRAFAPGASVAGLSCFDGCLPTFENDGTCDQVWLRSRVQQQPYPPQPPASYNHTHTILSQPCWAIECAFDGPDVNDVNFNDCTGCPATYASAPRMRLRSLLTCEPAARVRAGTTVARSTVAFRNH